MPRTFLREDISGPAATSWNLIVHIIHTRGSCCRKPSAWLHGSSSFQQEPASGELIYGACVALSDLWSSTPQKRSINWTRYGKARKGDSGFQPSNDPNQVNLFISHNMKVLITGACGVTSRAV